MKSFAIRSLLLMMMKRRKIEKSLRGNVKHLSLYRLSSPHRLEPFASPHQNSMPWNYWGKCPSTSQMKLSWTAYYLISSTCFTMMSRGCGCVPSTHSHTASHSSTVCQGLTPTSSPSTSCPTWPM
ncbi:hypothetical protein GWK47_014150 [Chionoecetes opilio]|uniref:Uncharacterized protein n=1 Tax=Chionoecetes opilio TaxID=41210 RepID=A0A8J5CIZ9_CHIOP|nr:hypothetical protein GWK47_014150 [Chionoecetes opilio]